MKNAKFALGLLAAASVGVLAGLLVAPSKGSTTRKKMLRKGNQYLDSLKNEIDDLVDGVSDKVEEVKSEVSGYADKVKGQVSDYVHQKKS